MKIKRPLIASICVIASVAILSFALWLTNPEAVENTLVAAGVKDAQLLSADTVPYMQKLLREIPVVKVIPKKRKDPREIWKVGRGVSFPNYLLRAQEHLNRFGGKVLYMEEKELKNSETVVDFDFIAPFGDTFYVELQVADTFHNNTSRLAVAFYADASLGEFSSSLNKLNYPYSLLITPADKDAAMDAALETLKQFDSVVWLPMESKELLPKKLSKFSIYIHQSEAEIRDIVSDARAALPKAKGFATRMGSRAVEQQVLLRTILVPLKEQGLWFWDLTGNRYSRTQEVCEDIPLDCRAEAPFNPARMTQEIYVEKSLKAARRSGKAVITLPLSNTTFKAIENLEAKAASQGTEIVNLSSIFQKE